MEKQRIQLTDTVMDIMLKMSDGNPGAAITLVEMLQTGGIIDPDNAFEGLGPILSLDSYGIYGTDIYVLHNDICGRDMVKTLAVLRAVQLGLFSAITLADACHRQDYSGRDMVPVEDLYQKVKEQLPAFNPQSDENGNTEVNTEGSAI